MSGLCDLVEIVENNMECVVLKVKENAGMALVCLGCFDGDETMMRLTKGEINAFTVFRKGREPLSWESGAEAGMLEQMRGKLISCCIADGFGIYTGGDFMLRRAALDIKSRDSLHGRQESYCLSWFDDGGLVCVERNERCVFLEGLAEAEAYVGKIIYTEHETGIFHSETGCCCKCISGRRR